MQEQEEGELSQDTQVIEKIREKLDLPKPEEKKDVENTVQEEKEETRRKNKKRIWKSRKTFKKRNEKNG